MKLYLYYAAHAFANQIKKLFRSWVAIIIVASLAFGILIGVGAALIGDAYDSKSAADDPAEEETIDPIGEEEIENGLSFVKENAAGIVGLVITGIVLVMFLFNIWRADKSGSQIFLMADVNLLFAAPMKPQSVLMFRLMSQIFLLVFAGVYLGFQIPNLVVNMGMSVVTALLIVAAWVMTIVYSQLLGVLVYTVTSTHTKLKRYISPFVLVVIALIGGSFYLYKSTSGFGTFAAANAFFNGGFANWIPVVGWIKGMVVFSMEGNLGFAFACLGLLVVGIAVITFAVWQIKADFYEDAMAGSMEREERMNAARNSRTGIGSVRKKERGDRVDRDGLWGSGAQMFFTKSLYNRFRFGILKVFTKTSLFYIGLAVLFSAFLVFAVKTRNFYIVGLGLCGLVFFRALGDPLSTDMEKTYFTMIPASSYAKVFWSALGGTVNCALDLLPALVISAVFLRASVATVIGIYLLAVVLDFYVSQVLLFIDLILPTSLAKEAKQAITILFITILFIYFGLMPPAAVIAIVGIFFSLTAAIYVAAVVMAMVGAVFYALSPLILDRGRR